MDVPLPPPHLLESSPGCYTQPLTPLVPGERLCIVAKRIQALFRAGPKAQLLLTTVLQASTTTSTSSNHPTALSVVAGSSGTEQADTASAATASANEGNPLADSSTLSLPPPLPLTPSGSTPQPAPAATSPIVCEGTLAITNYRLAFVFTGMAPAFVNTTAAPPPAAAAQQASVAATLSPSPSSSTATAAPAPTSPSYASGASAPNPLETLLLSSLSATSAAANPPASLTPASAGALCAAFHTAEASTASMAAAPLPHSSSSSSLLSVDGPGSYASASPASAAYSGSQAALNASLTYVQISALSAASSRRGSTENLLTETDEPKPAVPHTTPSITIAVPPTPSDALVPPSPSRRSVKDGGDGTASSSSGQPDDASDALLADLDDASWFAKNGAGFEIPLGLIAHVEKVGGHRSLVDALYGLDVFCKDGNTLFLGFDLAYHVHYERRHIFDSIVSNAFPLSYGKPLFAFVSGAEILESLLSDTQSIHSLAANPPSGDMELHPLDSFLGWDVGGAGSVVSVSSDYARMGIPNEHWRVSLVNSSFEITPSYPPRLVVPAFLSDEQLVEISKFRTQGRLPVLSWLHSSNGASISRCSQPKIGVLGKRSHGDEHMLRQLILSNRERNDKLVIIDARPFKNAFGNQVMGAGVENSSVYQHTEIEFMNIENIHVMRESLKRLQRGSPADWLAHVSLVLAGARRVVNLVDAEAVSVMVHCSDGWDRTPQLTALPQICLDPFYRTIVGFETLVQKEWISLGHKFAQRLGHGLKNHSDEQRSPIFLQFLDCVWQLCSQFPSAFEFNGLFLLTLANEMHTCRFGTFLFNNELERRNADVPGKTLSLWSFLHSSLSLYTNSAYQPTTFTLLPDTSQGRIQLWHDYYYQGCKRRRPGVWALDSYPTEIARPRAHSKASALSIKAVLGLRSSAYVPDGGVSGAAESPSPAAQGPHLPTESAARHREREEGEPTPGEQSASLIPPSTVPKTYRASVYHLLNLQALGGGSSSSSSSSSGGGGGGGGGGGLSVSTQWSGTLSGVGPAGSGVTSATILNPALFSGATLSMPGIHIPDTSDQTYALSSAQPGTGASVGGPQTQTVAGTTLAPSSSTESSAQGAAGLAAGAGTAPPALGALATRTNSVVIEGFLTKQGGNFKTWKRRWFVLDASTFQLRYFKSAPTLQLGVPEAQASLSNRPLGVIDIANCDSIAHEDGSRSVSHAFSVATPNRVYYMQADNQVFANLWVSKLQEVREMARQRQRA